MDNIKNILAQYEKNWNALKQKDQKAKTKGTLLNRYIQHQYADGYAVYTITKVNKASVQIRVVTGIGDDWVLPAWGVEARIPLNIAQDMVKRRDAMDALFSS